MKRFLKIFGVLVAVVIVAIITVVIYINLSGIPSYEPGNFEANVEVTPERLERGKKLTATLCAGCHMNSKTGTLIGKQMKDAPEEFGMIYAPNITNDKEVGIGDWTDGELIYLLRTGIKRDGGYAPPWMAKLPNMADEDINSIIAFLRSDDRLVAADPTPDQPCEPTFLSKMLCRVAFKPFEMPSGPISMPDTANTLEWGEYLAHNFECFSCHSADYKTNDFLNPENSIGYYGGGNKPLNLEGEVMLTSNLTPDKETGIGNWTKERFVTAVKTGQMEGEPALRYPMAPYALLTDAEAGAIYEYLMSLEPINNAVERSGL